VTLQHVLHLTRLFKAESQRNAEMLDRSRAALAEERARFEVVLAQVATFEEEKKQLNRAIEGEQRIRLKTIFL
jgi:hypothetical protein